MWLSGLCIQTVEQPAEVGHKQQIILDGNRTTGAMHRGFKVGWIRAYIVPYCCGIWILTLKIASFVIKGLQAFVWDDCLGIFGIVNQGWADIASLGGIDAPQMPLTFAMFRVFADADVHQTIIDDRCSDQVITSCSTAQEIN